MKFNLKHIFLILIFLTSALAIIAQNSSIYADSSTLNNSAMLDVSDTTNVFPPHSLNTTQTNNVAPTAYDQHAAVFAPVSIQGFYLQWNRSASGKIYLVNQKGTGTDGFVFAESNAFNVLTERMRIDDNGNVGIGENTPAYQLEVGGDINFQGVLRANGIVLVSDKRFKTNIVSLKKGLPFLMELEGVYHSWDSTSFPDKNFPNRREIGLIAQELQKVYPELVHEDKQGYLSVDFAKFSAVLLQAVKEQRV